MFGLVHRSDLLEGNYKIRPASLTSKKLAKLIAEFATDKKALDIVILDMKKVVNFCDYFVLCSATSDRQAGAIADFIYLELKDKGIQVDFRKGMKGSSWIVFDTGDVVTHIFQKDVREFYNLEYLWREAKVVKLD